MTEAAAVVNIKSVAKHVSDVAKAMLAEQEDDRFLESLRDMVFGDKRSITNTSSSNLERHHVVLKEQHLATLGTKIFCKVRKHFPYSRDFDMRDLVQMQNLYFQKEYGRLYPHGKVPSVCFFVLYEKALKNPEWFDPDRPDETRFCHKDIAYVRASEECLRDAMRNRSRRGNGNAAAAATTTAAATDDLVAAIAVAPKENPKPQYDSTSTDITDFSPVNQPPPPSAAAEAPADSTTTIAVPQKLFQVEAIGEMDVGYLRERLKGIIAKWTDRCPGFAERAIKDKLIRQLWKDFDKYETFLKEHPLVPGHNLVDGHAVCQSVHSSLLVDIANSFGNAMVDWYNCELLRINATVAPSIPMLPPGSPPDSSPPGGDAPPPPPGDHHSPGGSAARAFSSYPNQGSFEAFGASHPGGQEEHGTSHLDEQKSDGSEMKAEIPLRSNNSEHRKGETKSPPDSFACPQQPEKREPEQGSQSEQMSPHASSQVRPSSSDDSTSNNTTENDVNDAHHYEFQQDPIVHKIGQLNNDGVAALECGDMRSAIALFRKALNALQIRSRGYNATAYDTFLSSFSSEPQPQTILPDGTTGSKKPNNSIVQENNELDEPFFVHTKPKMLHPCDIQGTQDDCLSQCTVTILFNTALAYHQKGLLADSKALLQAKLFYDASFSVVAQMSSQAEVIDIAVATINNKAHIEFECGDLCGANTTMYDLLATVCRSVDGNLPTNPTMDELFNIMFDRDWAPPVGLQDFGRYIINARLVNSTFAAKAA